VLDPSIKRDEWAEHELRILFEAQQELGNVSSRDHLLANCVGLRLCAPKPDQAALPNSLRAHVFALQKWSEIAKRLPGRPEAAVKNTFYSSQRRARRRLQRFVRPKRNRNCSTPPPFFPANRVVFHQKTDQAS